MLCPTCGAPDTRVIDSRPAEGGQSIRRRRSCETCDGRFTTYERLEPATDGSQSGTVVWKPFRRQSSPPGSRQHSPIDRSLAPPSSRLLRTWSIRSATKRSPVTSEDIGHEVLARLRAVDEVAYLRFASVYKDFQDAADFEKEVAALESSE